MFLDKLFPPLAGFSGFLAVGLGAFGSHGLKEKLSAASLAVWQTSVQYHFYHTFALLAVAILLQRSANSSLLSIAGSLFLVGIFFFCGSLYWLALGGPRWLGPITPLGGLCFLVAWACLAIYGFKLNS
jgi:uncharacterized membrane protein YgdD (TMEM256/DUF423 family)